MLAPPQSEAELDEILSRPGPDDVEAVRGWQGPLLILGAGGKMGPSLAVRARRALTEAQTDAEVVAVSRFSDTAVRDQLEQAGVRTLALNLLDESTWRLLPDAPRIAYLAARKFGSSRDESFTWALNAYLPGRVADRFRNGAIVSFSSGNVYPFVPPGGGGATEQTPAGPVGEYAASVLGRERVFEYFSRQFGTRVALLRLNYAVELRYGVLLDVARKVRSRIPVPLAMGHANVIWQGDANSVCLRCFAHATSPPLVLNVTGPETISIRWLAHEFGRRFQIDPQFEGVESDVALLNNATLCHARFGYPSLALRSLIDWTAHWLEAGLPVWQKPTHFEVRTGRF
jgi:nucleoside-diphosphate-sugar epimerase